MRASVAAEQAGVRSVSIVASGVVKQAHAIARALGAENLAIAEYPGVPMLDSREELLKKVDDALINDIVNGLTVPVADSKKPDEPGPRDVVFKGTLAEIDEFFYDNLWTDGLPIIPPTIEKVEEFLHKRTEHVASGGLDHSHNREAIPLPTTTSVLGEAGQAHEVSSILKEAT